MGAIGGIRDAIVGKKLENASPEEFDKNKPILPWTQRVPGLRVAGMFMGGTFGFIIGSILFPPAGGLIGMMIGGGLAAVISGITSMVWGDWIYMKYAEFSTFLATKLLPLKNIIDASPQPEKSSALNPMHKVHQQFLVAPESSHDHKYDDATDANKVPPDPKSHYPGRLFTPTSPFNTFIPPEHPLSPRITEPPPPNKNPIPSPASS